MSLLKVASDKIEVEYHRMLQSGLDEQFFKEIPFLFQRIKELESALAPFGLKYAKERQFPGDVLTVLKSDCLRAHATLTDGGYIAPTSEITMI